MTFHSSRAARTLSVAAVVLFACSLWASTITVNSAADTAANDGLCTLREALTAANTDTASGALTGECVAGSGADDIVFNIPGAGVKLIVTTTPLPVITTPVHINGFTQPGASANSNSQTLGSNAVFLIEIDHGAVVSNATLTVSGAAAAGTIIEGLALSRSANSGCCANMGIYVTSTSNVWIRGNQFGADATGAVEKRFQDRAIFVDNANSGVIIGSDATALTPAYRNVVIATGTGITVAGTANNVTVRGNFVGMRPSGLSVISTSAVDTGIWFDNATGTSVVSDNVVAGTGFASIRTRYSNGAVIERNVVGYQANGTTPLGGNGYAGIAVNETTGAPLTNLTIRNNTVANSTGAGILVTRGTVTNVVRGVAISQNILRNNAGAQIDLSITFSGDGVTANDPLDADTGANNLQNFPVLSAATGDGTNVSAPYQLNSEPNQNFLLEFFRATACTANGHGGADTYLGSVNVITDASGNASGTASFASVSITGVISATATHAVNGTSEFSACATLSTSVVNVLLTTTKSGTGSGTITGTGINCGADCSESLVQNTVVLLTAVPTSGSSFVGWSGGGCSGVGTCSVTLSAAVTVNAQFDQSVVLGFGLTITKSGSGSGIVTDPTNGINCGVDCSEPFAVGALVTLTAVAAPGSVFIGWSGNGCSGTGTCVVTITAASIPPPVNAQFDAVIPPAASARPIPALGAPLLGLLVALIMALTTVVTVRSRQSL